MRPWIVLAVLSLILAGCGGGHAASSDARSAPVDRVDLSGHADAVTGADLATDLGRIETRPEDPVAGSCEPNAAKFPVRPEITEPATRPFLHVDGRDIVDAEGNPVALRGINFGSWLMMETWIAGIGEQDEGDLLDRLRQKAAELGLANLLAAAEDSNSVAWLLEQHAHHVLVLEWRDHMRKNAPPALADEVEQLWAWFDEQPWIFEEEALWKWLQGRFGYSKTEQLRLTFQQNYITEVDVARVAGLGLNLIRVPVWYQSLETDFEGENRFREAGWLMLHELGLWARKHGVYLMLDLHGAPGGQSTSWHQGLSDAGHLWDRPECIDKTVRLWKALASYFADDPHVAVYDLLNEPMSFPSPEDYAVVHDAVYRAIREVDKKHIVMLEDAYRPISQITSPAEMGWENAMFSIHDYPGGASAQEYFERIEESVTDLDNVWDERFDCPLFLGEFNAADGTDSGSWAAEAMGLVLARLNERGVHWAPWTWKYYSESTWGLYHPAQNPGTKIDVRNTTCEELLAAFENLHSDHFVPDPAYEMALESNATAPPAPLSLGAYE